MAMSADRHGRTIDGDRGNHGAESGTVGQPSVDDWRGSIESLADWSEYTFQHHVDCTVGEVSNVLDYTGPVDPNLSTAIDHHLIDVRVCEELCKRVEAVKPGHGAGNDQRTLRGGRQRCQPVDLSSDHSMNVTSHVGRLATNPFDQLVKCSCHHAAFRSCRANAVGR